jgi:hypothetical protein
MAVLASVALVVVTIHGLMVDKDMRHDLDQARKDKGV